MNMKLWIKYLVGIALGLAAAFILPLNSPTASAVLSFLAEFSIRFGRYTLLPLLFFGVMTAVFKLRDSHTLSKTTLWTIGVITGSTLILTIFGLVSILIVQLPRIPITVEKVSTVTNIGIKDMMLQMFPFSGFDALKEGTYLLPCFIFAGFAGAGCTTDKTASKAVISFAESASRLCYSIMCFFTECFALGMIAITCYWFVTSRTIFTAGVFTPLFIVLLLDFFLAIAVIYPLILHFLCEDPHPYRVLYAGIGPILTAFFSGDTNLSLVLNMRHGKESLGIHQRVNSVAFSLFSIFGRGGAALVISASFVVILRSYSSLGFTLADVLWILVTSFGLSFALGALPSGGPFIALMVLCTMYSRGFETGFLLLKPAAPVLCSFAAALDAATALYGSYIVGVKTHNIEHIDIKHYI
jgi:Na+/H+-dicarboxylate symporter